MANNAELLLKQLLSNDALDGIAKASGVGGEDVSKILTSALPSLMSGVGKQTSAASAAGFAEALMNHAKTDTSNMESFFNKVDLTDGNKIVAHLTGNADETAAAVASSAGVTKGAASSVLSATAPLLMSLLGKQSNATSSNSQANILSSVTSLLGGADIGGLAKAALTAYALSAVKNSLTGGKKKQGKKKDDIDLSDGIDLKDVIGIVGKIVK